MATLKEKKRKLKKMRARNIILNVCMFGCLRALVDYYLFLALH